MAEKRIDYSDPKLGFPSAPSLLEFLVYTYIYTIIIFSYFVATNLASVFYMVDYHIRLCQNL